jgi:hypothetical protein
MLILRTAGDEASALLGSVTLVGYMVTRIWAITAQGATRFSQSLEQERADAANPPYRRWGVVYTYRFIAGVLSILGLGLIGVSLLPGADKWITRDRVPWILVALGVLNVPIAWRKMLGLTVYGPLWWLSCVAVGPILLILALLALPFGPSLAFVHLFWEVTAESTPSGTWLTVQLDPDGDSENLSLRHSALYGDPQTHAVIAHWITTRSSAHALERG